MKPNRKLAEAAAPNGGVISLSEHDGSYCIRLNGRSLMHSSAAASELLLGELAAAGLAGRAHPLVLMGGLGLGFSLKGMLGKLGPRAAVQVAELIPEVLVWNRTFLSGLNGKLLDDPRVEVLIEDVRDVLARAGRDRYDAIVLDIDNGPAAMVQKANARLYDHAGIRTMMAALKPGGRAAIWSETPDHGFAARLSEAGLLVETIPAKRYPEAKRDTLAIYVADKPGG